MDEGTISGATTTTERALRAIRDLRAKLDSVERRQSEPVAIVGIGCRFPGADDAAAFWQLLLSGTDPLTDIPPDRWDIDALYSPDPQARGKTLSRQGGYIRDLDQFDAAFFGISPREAPFIDPRQRLILTTAWHALEDAGIRPDHLAGTPTSVVIGTLTNDYHQLITEDDRWVSALTGTGTSNSIIANRLSYVLDLHGPSLTVDTACSGSLLALHLACQTLRAGEATLAITGGVAVNLLPAPDICFSRMGALSPRSRCRTFDASGDGMTRSEGAGVVVLKLLSEAEAAGDRIYAVIRATAANHDGRSNGIAAPNGRAQEALLREAYSKAGISPGEVQYIEAHGTGTIVGDRIELQALAAVLGQDRPADRHCVVGSVKSNIGHTESSAGIAGVIKTALSLYHRTLPGNLHFETPHPALGEAGFAMEVRTGAGPFPTPDAPLIAGVSAFSFGGANVHAVLQEAPARKVAASEAAKPTAYLLPLSARSPEALRALAERYVAYLRAPDAPDIADICATAALRRVPMSERLSVAGQGAHDIAARLVRYLAGEDDPFISVGTTPDEAPKLAFAFSGQGSHWLGMGRDLYQTAPAFRSVIDRCDALFREAAGWSLLKELNASPQTSRLEDIDVVQPAIFAIQVGLVAELAARGVTPDVVFGQSMGEIAAAYTAGILTLEEAARIIMIRSQLIRTRRGSGATAVVGLPAAEAEAAIGRHGETLGIAGITSFTSTLIAGDIDALKSVLADLEATGVFCRLIDNIDVPAHSPVMETIRPQLEAAISGIAPQPATCRFLSTVTLADEPGPTLDPAYWGRNLRQPFRVAEAVAKLAREDRHLFLELSPHPVMTGAIRQTLQHIGADGEVRASQSRETDGMLAFAAMLGGLWVAGCSLNWTQLVPAKAQCVSLPSYPWLGEHYWIDQIAATTGGDARGRQRGTHPLLGAHFAPATGATQFWDGEIDPTNAPWLRDHAISGVAVLPGAAYLEMALAAVKQGLAWPHFALEDARFETLLLLPEGNPRQVQVTLTRTGPDSGRIDVLSRADGAEPAWIVNARIGVRRLAGPTGVQPLSEPGNLQPIDLAGFFAQFDAGGIEYGPAFRGLTSLRASDSAAIGDVVLPELAPDAGFSLQPALLDAAFQVVAAIGTNAGGARPVYLPEGVQSVELFAPVPRQVTVHALLSRDGRPGDPALSADISLCAADGAVLARISGLKLKRVDEMKPTAGLSLADSLYRLAWVEAPRTLPAITPVHAGIWLVVAPQTPIAVALSERLAQRGASPHIVAPDADVAAAIAAAGDDLRGVVLAGIDASARSVPDAVLCAVGTLALGIVQALIAAGERARLFIVTSGAIATDAADPTPDLVHAPLWGFGRVVGIEHPAIWGAGVDLDASAGPEQVSLALDEMLRLDDDREIALRGGRRLVGRMVRIEKPTAPIDPILLAPDSTYLITGGFTGLGLTTARFLAMRGARRLILIGRTLLPPRRTWSALDTSDPAYDRVAAVKSLESLGISVRVECLDIADEAALADFLAAWRDEANPPIRGIVHAAGVIQDALLTRMTPADVAAVMTPKVAGSWALHRQTADLDLDFFVIYSSASSTLGQIGQANYGAANTFEDALAWVRRALGKPALAVNWGPWADVGLYARLGLADRTGLTGVTDITPTQGMAALDLLMGLGSTQATVLNADWRQIPAAPRVSLLQIADPASDAATTTADGLAELLLMPHDERAAELEARVADIVAAVLRFDASRLDHRRHLTTLGMDSIMAVEIRNRIKRQFDVTPGIVDLFTSSVAVLAGWLNDQLAGSDDLAALLAEIEDLPDDEVEAQLADQRRLA